MSLKTTDLIELINDGKYHFDLNNQNLDLGDGNTAMHIATKQGRINILEKLIENDFPIDIKNGFQETSLILSCRNGDFGISKLLLKSNADPNQFDEDSETPVINAIIYNHVNILKLLYQFGANLSLHISDSAATPLIISIIEEANDCFDFLLDNLKHKVNFDQMAVIASKHNNIYALTKLVNKFQVNLNYVDKEENMTTISWAVNNSNEEICEYLFKYNIDLDFIQEDTGNCLLGMAIANSSLSIVKGLLEKNIDLEHKNLNGRTPIFWATSNGEIEILELLINKGANINCKDKYGRTPLMVATLEVHGGDREIIEYLLELGPDITDKDKWGNTFIDYLKITCDDDLLPIIQKFDNNFLS